MENDLGCTRLLRTNLETASPVRTLASRAGSADPWSVP